MLICIFGEIVKSLQATDIYILKTNYDLPYKIRLGRSALNSML